jgi:hypothetical protein
VEAEGAAGPEEAVSEEAASAEEEAAALAEAVPEADGNKIKNYFKEEDKCLKV